MSRRILVLAPHPDDEVLGVGGAMARWSIEGDQVYVAILTRVYGPEFDEEISVVGRHEAATAHDLLGVKETVFLDLPVLALDREGHVEVNRSVTRILESIAPDLLFIPFVGDLHADHQRFFEAAMVAARPFYDFAPKEVYAYETLSETNWNAAYVTPNFAPTAFVDITNHLDTKVAAMGAYTSQSRAFPHERSEQTIRALATLRGSTVNVEAAEAFVTIRSLS